jgi:HEAT repeat protein
MAQKRTSAASGEFNPDELLAFLRQDELDYPAAALKFGQAALPFLKELVASSDENLAMKAAYLVGYIEGDTADKILEEAAATGSVPIRVAAAFGAQKRSSAAAEAILNRSLEDSSPSVVKFALQAAKASKLEKTLKPQIDKISKNFLDDGIKMVASDMIKKLK